MAKCIFSKTYQPLWIEREECGTSNNVRISWYHYWRIKSRKKVKCCHFTLALNTYVPFSALWNEWILRAHINTSKTENLIIVLICWAQLFIDERDWWITDYISHSMFFHYKWILLVESAVIRKPLTKKKRWVNEWMDEMKLFGNSDYFIYMLNLWWGPQGMQWLK